MSIEFTLRSESTSTVLEHSITSFVVITFGNYARQNKGNIPIYSVVKDRESVLRQFAGEFTARVTPVSIPNTEVKPRWADGTARVSVWEIR